MVQRRPAGHPKTPSARPPEPRSTAAKGRRCGARSARAATAESRRRDTESEAGRTRAIQRTPCTAHRASRRSAKPAECCQASGNHQAGNLQISGLLRAVIARTLRSHRLVGYEFRRDRLAVDIQRQVDAAAACDGATKGGIHIARAQAAEHRKAALEAVRNSV